MKLHSSSVLLDSNRLLIDLMVNNQIGVRLSLLINWHDFWWNCKVQSSPDYANEYANEWVPGRWLLLWVLLWLLLRLWLPPLVNVAMATSSSSCDSLFVFSSKGLGLGGCNSCSMRNRFVNIISSSQSDHIQSY